MQLKIISWPTNSQSPNPKMKSITLSDIEKDMFKDSSFLDFLTNETTTEDDSKQDIKNMLITKDHSLIKFDGGRVLSFNELRQTIKRMKLDESKETAENNYVQCRLCDVMFTLADFLNHVCSKNKKQELSVLPNLKQQIENDLKKSTNKALRLLRDNQISYRRLLQAELKFDINACITSYGETSKTYNDKKFGPHECAICDRKFVHVTGLIRHMDKHDSDLLPLQPVKQIDVQADSPGLLAVLVCGLCGRAFLNKETAHDHLSDHFTFYAYTPPKPEFDLAAVQSSQFILEVLEYMDQPEIHNIELKDNLPSQFYKSMHTQDYFQGYITNCLLQCEFCEYFFTDTCFMLLHSSEHSPHRPFECFRCEIFCPNINEINKHWKLYCISMREDSEFLKNIPRYYECNVCENKFATLEILQEHRQTSEHPFPRFNYYDRSRLCTACELCSKMCYTNTELIAHYEENHYKSHGTEREMGSEKARSFLCEICGKSYTQSSHLWQHLRFHQGVKPFQCNIPGCERKFTIRPDLNDHIRKCHTGERPYHCLVCGKRFLTGSVFYQHRLIHRGERRYKCVTCGKKFYRADALKNHSRIHTGEKPYGCTYCTKTFRQRGDRDKHVKARHSHLDTRAKIMMQMQKIKLEAQAENEIEDAGSETDLEGNSDRLSQLVANISCSEMKNILASAAE